MIFVDEDFFHVGCLDFEILVCSFSVYVCIRLGCDSFCVMKDCTIMVRGALESIAIFPVV